MNNIFQIGPQLKLKEIVRSIVLRHVGLKTDEEIAAKYELMSEILEECQTNIVVQNLLAKVVNSCNLEKDDSSYSKIIPSLIRTLLDEIFQERDAIMKQTTSEQSADVAPT